MENKIWIEQTIKPRLITSDKLCYQDGRPVKLLEIECVIDGKVTYIQGDKNALLSFAKIVKTHFENQKL